MKFLYQMFVFGLMLFIGIQANGQIIYVKPGGTGNGSSWQNAFGDLQLALNSAPAGSQIWVAKGSYYPTRCVVCDSTAKSKSFSINKPLKIFGGFSGVESEIQQRNLSKNTTILSGDIDRDGSLKNNSFTILEIDHSNEGLLLDGLWFVMGNADGGGPLGELSNSGGAIYINGQFQGQESFSRFSNCIFQNNHAKGFGGAIYLAATFKGHIDCDFTQCVFRKNKAENDGGALYANGSFEGLIETEISYCQFLKNESVDKSGGAVFLSGSESGLIKSNFQTNVFYQNSAKQYGGSFYAFGKSGSCNPLLRNCTFEANQAEQGGAMYFNGSFNGESNPDLMSCWFKSNHAEKDGGAIYCLGSPNGLSNGLFNQCYFFKNKCGASGAAIFNNGSLGGVCNPEFNACRFFENSTQNYGGAVYNLGLQGASNPSFFNSLFFKNEAYSAGAIYNLGADHGNASPLIVHCTFIENTANVGGALYNNGSDSTGHSQTRIYNSLFQRNHAPTGDVFRNIFGQPEIAYSFVDVQNCNELNDGISSSILCGEGMIYSANQQMIDPLNENFDLKSGVEAIGSASSMVDSIYMLYSDIGGRKRAANPSIGCLEYQDSFYRIPVYLNISKNKSICEGEQLQLNLTNIDSNLPAVEWYFNGNALQGNNTRELVIFDVNFEYSGVYEGLVQINADTLYANPVSVFVVQEAEPNINLTLSDTAICQSDTIFISREVGGLTEPLEFFYYLDGNRFGEGSSNRAFVNPPPGKSFLEVYAIGDDSCFYNLNERVYSRYIEVHSDTIPLLSILGPDTAVCLGESVNLFLEGDDLLESDILWYVNDIQVQQGGRSFTSRDFEGISTVKTKWKCKDCLCIPGDELFESNQVQVETKECRSKNKNIFSNSRFSIYPNPSTGELKIDTGSNLLKSIRLFDASGNKLYETTGMHQNEIFSVRMDNNITGLCLVLLEFENRTEQEWVLLSN
jgi:predicted outer membrane repeat protein